jgi:hypothetical protein
MLASSRFLLLVVEMRAFTIAAIIAVLAVPANAQMGHSKGGGGGKLGKKKRRANSRWTAEKKEGRKCIQGRAQENSRSGQANRPVDKHAVSDRGLSKLKGHRAGNLWEWRSLTGQPEHCVAAHNQFLKSPHEQHDHSSPPLPDLHQGGVGAYL